MSQPRRHHYIPRSFLAAWTDTGTVEGQLSVIDKKSGKSFVTSPGNTGLEADLYTLDLNVFPNLKAMEIEESLSQIEGAAIPVVKGILKGNDAVSGEDLENVVALIATLTLRVPARLDWIEGILENGYILGSAPAPEAKPVPEKLNRVVEAVMSKHENSQDRSPEVIRNEALAMAFSQVALVFRLLMGRRWTALRARDGAGDLVCTDHPVLLEWVKAAPEGMSPGFGVQNTAVFVPLGPSTGVLGLWGQEPKDRTLSEKQMSFWNGQLLGQVDRFVFSRGDFCALHKTDAIDRRADVLARWSRTAASP